MILLVINILPEIKNFKRAFEAADREYCGDDDRIVEKQIRYMPGNALMSVFEKMVALLKAMSQSGC